MTREEHIKELERCCNTQEPFDFFGNMVHIVRWEWRHDYEGHKMTCTFLLSDHSKFEVKV